MINTRRNMIIVKGVIRTSQIKFCQYNPDTRKMDIVFSDDKKYSYSYSNVEYLKDPEILTPELYHIRKGERDLFNIEAIYRFFGENDTYYHICFQNKSERDYRESELEIFRSCLSEKSAGDVWEYFRQVANLSEMRNEESGEKLLVRKFEKLPFVDEKSVLAKYLNPDRKENEERTEDWIPIFPFGCNNSQYKAVKRAMENQISVIQGPPGTGKTQTILNIIANILMQGKSVQVVSNNNSATDNVYEKLASPKYGMGFLVAALGNSKNKQTFIQQQNGCYPDLSTWRLETDPNDLKEEIFKKSKELKTVFDKKERLSDLRQEYSQMMTELEYFRQYIEESDVDTDVSMSRRKLTSKRWMEIWRECQFLSERKGKIGLLFILRHLIVYGITGPKFFRQDMEKIITSLQAKYYQAREEELLKEIEETERFLNSSNENLMNDLCKQSMILLKGKLAEKYGNREKRKVFEKDDLFHEPYLFLDEYPITLSTTFSSRNSLGNGNVMYDYLIMDEASQVDVATGALALSGAKNAIIVGDTKQLPNIVPGEARAKAEEIFGQFHISEGYQFTRSFLQSVLDVLPDVTQTLLREHYRCHPKIINFCNQKFYRGELLIMTEDRGESDVLHAIKTVPGNHAREHYSQRQIDVIKKEILSQYDSDKKETGIISPYRDQVNAIQKEIPDVETATVHKFQGKEKDTIIISTVDDMISDFADDPYLINVAVSRAKKRLILVMTGNEQTQERNITDLMKYIQYNNFQVTDSKIYSIFDYLYGQYTKERTEYMKKHKRKFPMLSEDLAYYTLMEKILNQDEYASLNVLSHFPLNMLIRNPDLLEERECRYAMNPATHIDFLIYNRISKKPVMALEIDGYQYHRKGTQQAERDQLKNHILEVYGIPLLRLSTNGSGEEERIKETLDKQLFGS